jgi:4a-hydroxytetrahydrobiopterin dehydratase
MAALKALDETQIEARLARLRGWERDGMVIRKAYAMETYMTGLAFAAAVGTVCEARGHHPDILIGWRRVVVSFTTHDAGGMLTDNDFDAAEAVDALGYPPQG